jgi:hypothetical protein
MSIRGLGHDLEPFAFEQHFEALSNNLMVVGNQYGNRHLNSP